MEQGGLLFIGEAPGAVEERLALKRPPGLPFQGKTGDEVNRHYLPLAGLRREAVTFTNAIRCLPPGVGGKLDAKRAKDLALLHSCVECHLYPLIERLSPRALVPMGAFACRAICPDVDLEVQHGFPTETAWGIPAFPMYHPALGIHEPKRMLHIRTDWQRLRSFLSGRLVLPVDDYPNPDYREVTDASEIHELDPSSPLAVDTESTRRREPYCLTYSQVAGSGRLIRAERADLVEALNARLHEWHSPILFHNWLYDWPVTAAMGLHVPYQHVMDTMARVFHLGNLPQGLKALAWRELGMTMEDFMDVVTPYSTQLVLAYYREAYGQEWPRPDAELIQDDRGLWKLYKPQGMRTKLKRFFTDYMKSSDKDVFAMWEDNWESSHSMIEAVCGEWPGRCISHVPFERVLHYSARDADATLRLWPVLEHMRRRVRKTSQEHWRAA